MNANSLLASPTGLSPYLRFGCLSCRLFYYRLWELYKKVRQKVHLESRLVLSIDSMVLVPRQHARTAVKVTVASLVADYWAKLVATTEEALG